MGDLTEPDSPFQLTNCCGCISLKNGSLILGILSLIMNIFIFGGTIVVALNVSLYFFIVTAVSLMVLIPNILFIRGVKNEKVGPIKLWLTILMILFIFDLLSNIQIIMQGNYESIAGTVFYAAFSIYFILVIRSYKKELQLKQAQQEGERMVNNGASSAVKSSTQMYVPVNTQDPNMPPGTYPQPTQMYPPMVSPNYPPPYAEATQPQPGYPQSMVMPQPGYPQPMAMPQPGYPQPMVMPQPGYPQPMAMPQPGCPQPMAMPQPGYPHPQPVYPYPPPNYAQSVPQPPGNPEEAGPLPMK